MKKLILTISLLLLVAAYPVKAQKQTRETQLAAKILERVPDLPSTRKALGRGEERPARALRHAKAIVAAADMHRSQWTKFKQQGEWEHFSPRRDLPALIAAITLRESWFTPVIRIDGGGHVTGSGSIPARIAKGGRPPAADRGVMQVRAPSRPARQCGVTNNEELRWLVTNLEFSYKVGTCILTKSLKKYVPEYSDHSVRKLAAGHRPAHELKFFGLWGPRKNTDQAALAKELVVIERYNWGNRDLYDHPTASGYARRVLTEFEFFRITTGPDDQG